MHGCPGGEPRLPAPCLLNTPRIHQRGATPAAPDNELMRPA